MLEVISISDSEEEKGKSSRNAPGSSTDGNGCGGRGATLADMRSRDRRARDSGSNLFQKRYFFTSRMKDLSGYEQSGLPPDESSAKKQKLDEISLGAVGKCGSGLFSSFREIRRGVDEESRKAIEMMSIRGYRNDPQTPDILRKTGELLLEVRCYYIGM